jgi:hypothetical protein
MKPLLPFLAGVIGIAAGYIGMAGGRAILNLVEREHPGVSVAGFASASEPVKFHPSTQWDYGFIEMPFAQIAPTPTPTTIAASPKTIAAAPIRHSRTVRKHKRMARREPNFLQKLFVGFVELQKTGKIRRHNPYAFSRSPLKKYSANKQRPSKFRG